MCVCQCLLVAFTLLWMHVCPAKGISSLSPIPLIRWLTPDNHRISLTGYEGITCSQDVDECAQGTPCNNGTCRNSLGSFSCLCGSEYLGDRCEYANPCHLTVCGNGGSCNATWHEDNQGYQSSCSCVNGFKGELCEQVGSVPLRIVSLCGLYCLLQGCRFSVFSIIFGPIHSLFSPISSFSFWTFCLFLCSFSVRRHTHVDFQLFSQKSSGIPVVGWSVA